jgi:hypothetical protein
MQMTFYLMGEGKKEVNTKEEKKVPFKSQK